MAAQFVKNWKHNKKSLCLSLLLPLFFKSACIFSWQPSRLFCCFSTYSSPVSLSVSSTASILPVLCLSGSQLASSAAFRLTSLLSLCLSLLLPLFFLSGSHLASSAVFQLTLLLPICAVRLLLLPPFFLLCLSGSHSSPLLLLFSLLFSCLSSASSSASCLISRLSLCRWSRLFVCVSQANMHVCTRQYARVHRNCTRRSLSE